MSGLTESASARFLGITVDQLNALSGTGYAGDKFLPSPLHWVLGYAGEKFFAIDALRQTWVEMNV